MRKRFETFAEFMRRKVGAKWVFAARSTPRLRSMYPGSIIIPPTRQRELKAEYADQHRCPTCGTASDDRADFIREMYGE